MRTIIENATILAGPEFNIIEGFIEIKNGKIQEIGSGSAPVGRKIDAKKAIVLPGLINAHTHIGDSIAKEAALGKSLKEAVEPPFSIKHKILQVTSESDLIENMRLTAEDMLESGITCFADFREGGIVGVNQLKTALTGLPIKRYILGRLEFYFAGSELLKNEMKLNSKELAELDTLLKLCDGFGFSAPSNFTDPAMIQIAERCHLVDKIVALHAAEDKSAQIKSIENTKKSEIERSLALKPFFLVHCTHPNSNDLNLLEREKVPVVCCPRSNSVLGLGFPPIKAFIERKIPVALGTDNIMLNSPDLFREMEYTSKMLRALTRDPNFIDPIEILKMTTLNAAKALKIDKYGGTIEKDKNADIIAINIRSKNLYPVKNPVATIIHRVHPENIQFVMIDGEIAFG